MRKIKKQSNHLIRMVALLALLLIGVNASWAQTSLGKAEINAAPTSTSDKTEIAATGNIVGAWYKNLTPESDAAITIGGHEIQSKWFVKLAGDGFIKIRVTKGSVVAGDILRVEVADIYQNVNNQKLGFQVEGSGETAGITETDNDIHTIDYILKAGDIREDPEDGTYDYIQINRNGNTGCGYHSIEILTNRLVAASFKKWETIDGNSSTGTATGGAVNTTLGIGVDAGGTVFGDGNVYYLNYVNVKGGSGAIMPDAKSLIIEGDPGISVRILFNRTKDNGTVQEGALKEEVKTIPSNGKLYFSISGYDIFHLNAIKIPSNGTTGNVVTAIRLSNEALFTIGINLADFPEGLPSGCDAWFTIGDDPTKYREAKTVSEGINVTYTMSSSNPHYTPVGWRTESWHTNDVGWMGRTASFTTTIRGTAILSKDGHDCSAGGHTYAQHEQMLAGDINAAPEFSDYKEGCAVTFVPNNADWGTVTATVNGNPITSGSLVPSGTEVKFTATASSSNYVIWGWEVNGATNWTFPNPYTVTEDVTITHNFTPGILLNAINTNGTYGDVTITGGGKNGNLIRVTPWAGDITFKATPKANGQFGGWFYDVDCNNPVEAIDGKVVIDGNNVIFKNGYIGLTGDEEQTGRNFNLWGKFTGIPLKTINKPECNHYGDRTHGDNYFDIRQINPAEGVTLGEWNSETGRTVTVPTNGGYMSFAFENEYNLSDLVKWTISDNADLRARVNSVEFLDANGNQLVNCYTNAGNRQPVGLDVQSKLTKVKEIRIHFKESNDEHQYNDAIDYPIKWICFSFEHTDRTLPTLIDGTAADMEIYETTSLSISNTPGYWRQFTDNNYNVIKKKTEGGLIDETKEWKTNYKFDNMQQGDYYFGARDGGSCALGYNHQTDLVPVHVHVKALDIIDDISLKAGSAEEKSFDYDSVNDIVNLYYKKTIDDPNVSSDKYPEVSLTVKSTWNSRDNDENCTGVKFSKDKGTELMVEAPNGYRVQKVDITFGHDDTKYNVSMNRGNAILHDTGNSITYTNNSTYDYVRMVVRNEAADDEKEVHVTNVKVYLVPVNAKIIDESRDINVEGVDRKYWLYVPENVKNGSNRNVPVVFALHGGGEDYEPTHNGQLNFNSLADVNNFVVVYPRAAEHYFYHFNGNKARAWEATGAVNNDTKLFEAIIEALKTNTDGFSIDEKKIYMAGFSVGGMMAYATANVLSKKFAAFASIAGLPMNEVHQRTHSARPVPFLHVHGTKDDFVRYDLMPAIVDNMLNRNGLSYTPTATVEGEAGIWGGNGLTRYKKLAYGDEQAGAETKTGAPYIYYQIGTGMTANDTGMGHNHWCRIGDKDVKQVMWEFFKGRSVPTTITNPFEFKADINTANDNARQHGWLTNTSTGILAQYGESGGYTRTNQNVYHSIQLNPGTHYISFNITGSDSEHYVRVRVAKLADITGFDALTEDPNKEATVEINEKVIVDNAAYKVGSGKISVKFDTAEPTGEYIITVTKGGQYDDTKISNIQIDNVGPAAGEKYTGAISTDFTGYFNYNNRLFAQWNFDLSDGYRANALKLAANPTTWDADYSNTNTGNSSATNGTIIFKNKNAIGIPGAKATELGNYDELTYDGSLPIAIAAGLKFMAYAGDVKLLVDLTNGQVSGAHLELAKGVKMHIPYVENSYRNDKNENVVKPSGDGANLDDFNKCMHHINRDIIYIAMNEGNVWQYIKNKCLNEGYTTQDLFRSGGDEFVNGKTYNKADYMGIQGTPCFIEFNKTGIIDRIGVNRNMIYSFYTENINELGSPKPGTRFRVVGSPWGSLVADEGRYTKYEGAIAMTYGGWQNSKGESSYTKIDGTPTTDAWTDLGVINYEPNNSAVHFKTWGDMKPSLATTNSIAAIDGFPVAALLDTEARSGSLLPSSLAPINEEKNTINGVEYVKAKDENGNYVLNEQQEQVWIPNYFPECEGKYMVPTEKPYRENITPWSLPSRGGYAKFEPSIPGVLNMNVIQNGGHDYYIADEFGNLVDQRTIFSTTGTKQSITKTNGCYRIANTDYVKHVLNVEPGKTYYIFSNTTGLGVVGFYFEPYVNHDGTERGRFYIGVNEEAYKLKAGVEYALPANVNRTETITSPDGGSGKNYTINYSQKAVKVNLRRAFHKNQWETICLPYSMNQVQMEQVFGEGTRVVLLRDVQDKVHSVDNKVTLTLVCHENQDIIAGYPYLIRPTQEVQDGVETISSLPSTDNTPSLVTVSSVGRNTNSYDYKTYGGVNGYTFQGHYGGNATVNEGSYAVNEGKLCRIKTEAGNGTTISGYRAWIQNDGGSLAKAITCFKGIGGEFVEDDNTTDIDEVNIDKMLEKQGIFTEKSTIYSINGQVVRKNAANLNDLPKGIYVVNGKKYIVK